MNKDRSGLSQGLAARRQKQQNKNRISQPIPAPFIQILDKKTKQMI
ncbi:hypothetical protein KTH89_08820 [Lachnospiraceae bacterium ASD5720]|uniref:Uncharacterized protein n=1 Tax=Diplocloster agilis TaxID=2850323 RepID=A0A949JWU8_9FIRM|nr:hypothetical protein [Diplocloster agilis]